jgi:hypothetical protein
MAMNKQRFTSNLFNILSYDAAGNIVLKDYSQTIRYNWNGTIHAFTGPLSISSIAAAVTDTDRFLVSDGGVLKYRTGAEVLSDIGAFILPSLTSGSVLFSNGTTIAQNNANFFWDNANGRLGIGTNAPAYKLHSVGNAFINGSIFFGDASHYIDTNNSTFCMISSNRNLQLARSGTASLTITSNFNTVLQAGGTITDSGQRLQVMGDAFIKGSGATSALLVQNSAGTEILKIQNNSSVNIKAPTNTEDLNILFNIDRPNLGKIVSITDQAAIQVGNSNFIAPSTGIDGVFVRASGGLFIGQKDFNNPTTGYFNLNIGRPNNVNNQVGATTEQGGLVQVIGLFNPNTAVSTPFTSLYVRPTINQTGGASGITRGLYINPTLTAAADWRSIEWSNNSGWGLYGAGTANNYLGGNLGVGVTPSAWSALIALQVGATASLSGFTPTGEGMYLSSNAFFNGSSFIYQTSAFASQYVQLSGIHRWYNAPSGTAGNAITFTQAMTLTAGGNLLVGTTTDQGYRVQITSASADSQLNVWGATAPSIRLDNAASGATQRFVIGLATATNNFIQGANAGDVCMTPGTSSALVFGMWQTSSSSEVMRISTSSNVLIGKNTDSGQKLQVVGKVNLTSLPTSATGLMAGDIWNNGGVLNIV